MIGGAHSERVVNKALVLAALMGPGFCAAQQTTGAPFLGITHSARSYSLGLSNVVSALGAQAIGANPANLGLMRRRFEAFSSYATLMDGSQYEHLAAAFAPSSLSGVDAFGLSVTRLQTGGIQGADAQGNKTGSSLGSSDMAVTMTGAVRPMENLHLGLSVKAIQSELAGYKSNMAMAGDLGATYTLAMFRNPISIGASLNNVGQGLRFLNQTDPLPSSLSAGVALPLGPATAVVSVSRELAGQRTTLGTGLELGMGPVLFRAGMLTQSDAGNLALKDQTGAAKALNGLSGGLGLRLGAATFDYAISQQAVEFGPTQRVSFSLTWGGSRQDRGEAAHPWRRSDESDWQIRSLGGY